MRLSTYTLLYLWAVASYAQTQEINQRNLPYTIPVLQEGSSIEGVQSRWLENNSAIPGATGNSYTIPTGKAVGIYEYINQVRCEGCSDWLSSNPFTVSIYSTVVSTEPIEVTFSPQITLDGYLTKLISIIDNTQHSLDIALYSLRSYEVYKAIQKATLRRVQVRMLFDEALEDRNSTEETISHQVEELGVDVRYVNKINHHKFLVSDNGFLVSASGNWNDEANWVYDENALWITDEELVLRFRAEFEHLWTNSRPFGEDLFSTITINRDSLLNHVVDNPDVDAIFTSSNYRTYISSSNGPTFALISGNQKVADRIVEHINAAQYSIHIAANHLRSRPISEALIQRKIQRPDLDIKVYLDQLEFITQQNNNLQIAEREACLAEATTPGQTRDCLEKDFYWSYELIKAGIEVRFKTYSYRWHQNTASLMHHKYAVFDDSVVATGSYNYSYNAETNSMENVVFFNAIGYGSVITEFNDNFETIWNTGRDENYFGDILTQLASDSRFVPVLFPSMALTYDEVNSLMAETQTTNPSVNDAFFYKNRQYFSVFPRDVELSYDADDRLVGIHDSRDNKFTSTYTYNSYGDLTSTSFLSNDGIQFAENYEYSSEGNLSNLSTPQLQLSLTYSNNELATVNTGRGNHSWSTNETEDGASILRYSTPTTENYLTVSLNRDELPTSLTDADSRTAQWIYDSDYILRSINSAGRNIVISENSDQHKVDMVADNGETLSIHHADINQIAVSTAGTVNSSITYNTVEQPGKKVSLTIDINSLNVTSGKGKTASIDYLLDPYGRVVQSGNMTITREPYAGNIVSIVNEGITEIRAYNDWELLTLQEVVFNGQLLYKATYEYDGLQRINHASEIILGDSSEFDYAYNAAGQLINVRKNGIQTESYTYDDFGNRLSQITPSNTYTYSYDINNRLNQYSWQQSGNTRRREFTYNNSGQLLGTVNKTINGSSAQITASRSYVYDFFGNLNNVSWASQSQDYSLDTYNRRIASHQNGSVRSKLVYGLSDAPLAELNENDRIINTFIYADGFCPVLMRKGAVDYYIISDIRGSVRLIVRSSNGDIRQKINYDAFGNIQEDTNPGYSPFGFAGGLYDSRTGLLRFGARDYSPEIGRWTTEDPIGFWSGDVNFYAYVGNDPINFVDPSGLSRIKGGLSKPDFDKLVQEARLRYPKKAEKNEDHHIDPKYMGGDKNGPTAPLNAAYHQVITNAFRDAWRYGQAKLDKADRKEILDKVYTEFPLPPGYSH